MLADGSAVMWHSAKRSGQEWEDQIAERQATNMSGCSGLSATCVHMFALVTRLIGYPW